MKIQPILRAIRNADQDFSMIEDGDRIAVALSGGKDSMLLFLALSIYQKFSKHPFELCAIHVDVGFEDKINQTMIDFAKQYNLELYIEKTKIFEILKQHRTSKGRLPCSLCSTLKKGVIFERAKELSCNKIALGHHQDDAIETLFMNMIHGSKIATFQPVQYMSRMNMSMIRPLIYCKESQIIHACQINEIPSAKKICPNDGITMRQEMKEMLENIYQSYPQARDNFLTALSNEQQISLWHKKKHKTT